METAIHWLSDAGIWSNGVTGVLQRECLQKTSLGVEEEGPVVKWRELGEHVSDGVW